MLTFIREFKTLWDYLKTAGKPIVLYGTGNGADKVMERLSEHGISVAAIFVSDEFARGQQFHGYTVRRYSELIALQEKVIVLVAFASELPEMLARFYDLAQIHETYAPHVSVFSGDDTVTPEWIKKYEKELQTVYDGLADGVSREVFAAVLNYKLSGKLVYLQACTTDRREDLRELFSFGEKETYVDLGAYDGDTVGEFLQLTQRQYSKIYAVEPDPKNFKKLENYARRNDIAEICCLQAGIWSGCGKWELSGCGGRQSTFWGNRQTVNEEGLPERIPLAAGPAKDTLPPQPSARKKVKKQEVNVVSVDYVLGEHHADYMKFDVEGVEKEAIEGAKGHLMPDRDGKLPKLLIAAYHHDEDIFALPLLLWKMQPGYKIYLRKHPYVPAWEINIFAK